LVVMSKARSAGPNFATTSATPLCFSAAALANMLLGLWVCKRWLA
jgi:hypothetical protein